MEAKKTSCFSVWEVDSCRVLVLFPCLRRDYQKPSWAGKSSLESLSLDLIVSGEVGVQHAQWCPQTVRPSNETENRKPFSHQNILDNIAWKKKDKKNTQCPDFCFCCRNRYFLLWYFMLFPHILLPLDKPILPPSTRQVRRRVDLDLKAHDAFLVGREKNCDVVLEGLEMLGRLKRRFSVKFLVYQILLHQILVRRFWQISIGKFEMESLGGEKWLGEMIWQILAGFEDFYQREIESKSWWVNLRSFSHKFHPIRKNTTSNFDTERTSSTKTCKEPRQNSQKFPLENTDPSSN